MADVINRYNHTLKKLWNKEIDYTTLKVMLLNNSATFNATHTTLAQVAGASPSNELSGNGWDVGGELIANVQITIVNTSGAMIDGDDVRVTASGGPIPSAGPAYKAVVYDDSDVNDAPLWFITFDAPQQAGSGTDFLISWHSNGIARNNWV